MKNFKIIFLFLTFFAVGTALTSCSDTASKSDKTEQQSKEYASAYICPMHCEGSGSDKEGKCPKCGMDYVKNDKQGGGDHDGHNH